MHTAASQITKAFNSKISQEFGESFTYNNVYFCKINTTPYTIEEYVDGQFKKWINNNGVIVPLSDMATIKDKEIFLKAQCFVHYTYEKFDKKLMVLDIQGSGYTLFDPEICTTELIDTDSNQIMFCCGNLSITGIETFLSEHRCNKYCQIMIDKEKLISAEDSSSEYE
ncbi:hypothetical protein SNE40_003000 [Patella caerulea]|uniref:Alpha-type protein kinase domain-containing protein n=1 Tax=Patella caerulea TaxID=87958 RepID=A0AAN8PZU5_PATCE